MTTLGYIGTAAVFTGIGFLAASFWTRRTIVELEARQDRLVGALMKAGAQLRALGLDKAADAAFSATNREVA